MIHIQNPFKERIADIGMTQSGKTNWLLWYLSCNKHPYTLFDTIGSVRRAMQKGWTPLYPKTQLIVTPPNWESIEPAFKKAAAEVWAKGNMQFFIDDIAVRREIKGKLKPYLCDKFWIQADLAKLMNQGGNRNISVNFTAQRPAQVHNDLLASCMHHIIFKLYLPADIDWYADVVGRETAEASQNLEQFEFIYKELGKPPQFCKAVKKMYWWTLFLLLNFHAQRLAKPEKPEGKAA